MKKSKKYKHRFSDFCAEAWMNIHATEHQARALHRGMQDAIMNPLEDLTKVKSEITLETNLEISQ